MNLMESMPASPAPGSDSKPMKRMIFAYGSTMCISPASPCQLRGGLKPSPSSRAVCSCWPFHGPNLHECTVHVLPSHRTGPSGILLREGCFRLASLRSLEEMQRPIQSGRLGSPSSSYTDRKSTRLNSSHLG